MSVETSTFIEPDFRRLFEAGPHPYLILQADAAYTIVAVNDAYLAATCTSRSTILGRGLFDVFPDNPDDHSGSGVSDLRRSLERVCREGVRDVMGVQKYDIPRLEGEGFEVKYWSPVNSPLFGPDGKVSLIIHQAEDITEFILARERQAQEISEKVEQEQQRADFMEAEVLRRASEVKEANRQIKLTMAALEEREADLARANQQLKELDRAKTDFFSNVSHEFRTPLTLMLGPLEDVLGKHGGELSPFSRAALETAHRNALRLLKLVNTLLDFSRIEAGRGHIHREATDLPRFSAELASAFDSACGRAGLKLVVDCPPLPKPVFVDRSMWEKIVLNLVSNAFKFTFDGEIEVRTQATDDGVRLSVRDTGTGIPAHELPNLFERFRRVEGARGRSHEGSGIGLALVQDLVQLHGGTIRVESEVGRGTTFLVDIPYGMPTSSAEAENAGHGFHQEPDVQQAKAYVEEALHWLPESESSWQEDEAAGTGAVTSSCGHILVADDNNDMRGYICRLLEDAGFLVSGVKNGAAAIEFCRTRLPDLILSDVMMPVMDGFEMLEQLRADESTAGIPVLLLSARAGEEARVEGLSAGADDYIVKPFNARELVARVDGAIRLARTRREAALRESDIISVANRQLSQEVEERKRAEAQLVKYMEELRRSNEELDEFAYVASHDLKEPLRGIHNYASFLQEDYAERLDDEGRNYLNRMQRLAERQSALIDRLLAYSRLGSTALKMIPVDVDAILDEVAEDLKSSLASQGVELRRTGRLPTVVGDATRIGEIFQNLISNGAKYSDKPLKWVEVGCDPTGPQPIFHVRDNGIGIAPQHHDNVFRIFKRLHEQNKFGGGTGAGLTIVKKIVERHGGRIWLESIPGEGTTFFFTLTGAQ